MIQQLKVSLRFMQYRDSALADFALQVAAGLSSNPTSFPALPVSAADLTALQEIFETRIVAATGRPEDTSAKNEARADLLTALRSNALYVEIACGNVLSVLQSSAFGAASSNRASTPLDPVQILSVTATPEGDLKARVKTQRNAHGYQGRIKAVGGEFGPVLTFKNSRTILFKGLTAGVTYVMELCAIGGKDAVSPWSEPASKMAVK